MNFNCSCTEYEFNHKWINIHTFFPPNPINSKSRMIRGGSNEIIKLKVPTPTLTPLSKSFLWISPSQFRYCKIFQHSLKIMMEIGDEIQFNFKHFKLNCLFLSIKNEQICLPERLITAPDFKSGFDKWD